MLRFDNRVAIVTGAGAGLGRVYATLLASRGAKVVVNDLGGSSSGEGASRAADVVVAEIRAAGGEAVANYDSCTDGAAVVATAIDTWGRVDIVVNNAGILRDVSFHKMQRGDWDKVLDVHVNGCFSVTHAAWPHMREAQYGRVICVSSVNGMYGAFGQANYAAAKAAITGFARTLAKEGAKRNIKVNVVCPGAGSRLTATVMPPEMVEAWKAEYVGPMIANLAHEDVPCSGAVFEAGGGFFAQVRHIRAPGLFLDLDGGVTPEGLRDGWAQVTDFTDGVDPETDPSQPQLQQIMSRL